MNKNNMNKQELCDKLQKSVKDKVPNFTAWDMNRKVLSAFMNAVKWRTLKPDVYRAIKPNNYLELWAPVGPNNSLIHIPIKHNFSQTFGYEIFYGRVMKESEVLCVVLLMTSFFFLFLLKNVSFFVINQILQEASTWIISNYGE